MEPEEHPAPLIPLYLMVGYPRSGTTILRSILSSHPDIDVHHIEPHYVLQMYRKFGTMLSDIPAAIHYLVNHYKFPLAGSDRHGGSDRQLTRSQVEALFTDVSTIRLETFLRRVWGTMYPPVAGERHPLLIKHPAMSLHIEKLRIIFRDLHVLTIVRDPRAAISSHYARWPDGAFRTRCENYNRSTLRLRRQASSLPGKFIAVRYEDLLADTELTLTKLCDFFGVPFNSRLLTVETQQQQWGPKARGEYKKFVGVNKQGNQKWKNVLKPVHVDYIQRFCREAMVEFDYEPVQVEVSSTERRRFQWADIKEYFRTRLPKKVRNFVKDGYLAMINKR